MEDIPIMVLTNQMELDVGKTLCQETTSALDGHLVGQSEQVLSQVT